MRTLREQIVDSAGAEENGAFRLTEKQAEEERYLRVERAVSGMPDPDRRYLVDFYWRDLSVRDIAQAEGIPEGTVKSRLARARQTLKTRIAGEKN